MEILSKAYRNSIEILFSGLEIVHDPCVQLLTLIQRLSTLTPPDDEDERLEILSIVYRNPIAIHRNANEVL